VFSSWTSTLDVLESLLGKYGIRSLKIDGRVGYAKRLDILDSFRNEPLLPVLLISIQTGAVGCGICCLTNLPEIRLTQS